MSLVLNRIEDRVQNEGAISPPMLRMLLNVLKATSPVFRESCIQNYLTYFVNRNLLVVSEEERDALLGDRLQEILDDPEMDPSEGAHWLWRDVSHHSECTEGKITRLVYNGADINKLKGALDERAADHHKSLISHKDKVEIVQAKVESLKKAADAAKVKRDAVVEELTFKRQAAVDNATPLGRDPITIIAEYFKPTRREIVDLCYAQQG